MKWTKAEKEFVGTLRVARLATVDARGIPHNVPVCPLLDGGKIFFGTDAKAKKLRNIEANPRVAIGTILGTVTDSSEAVIPDAQVQITNTATNVSTQVVTNSTGNYRVPYLPPGVYSVAVERAGFKKYVRTGLEVQLAGKLELNITLDPGELTQQVVVTEETPLLSVADGSRGAVIDRTQLQELPIKDGSAAELIVLAPGVANTTDLRPRKAAFSQGLSLVSTNGVGEARNDFTVDGIPNVVSGGPGGGAFDASSFTKVGVAFPSAAIQELVVQTNVYDATQGHTPGGVFNMVTRGGTNEFHGEAHEFLKNRALNANDFFSRMSGLPKSNIRDHRYGFSIGARWQSRRFMMGTIRPSSFFPSRITRLPRRSLVSLPYRRQRSFVVISQPCWH